MPGSLLTIHGRVRPIPLSTEPGRKAFLERFEREVDPEGVLPPAERQRRAGHLKKAYFTKLALASSRARRRGGGNG